MRSRNLIRGWFGAALLGAGLATSPCLFGGGGDEGVDILPNIYGGGNGGSGAGSSGDPAASGNQIPHGVVAGYVAVHGKNAALDANWLWAAPGLRLPGHDRSDLFLGTAGNEPNPRGETALDIVTKGSRKLMYGEFLPTPGALGGGPESLTLNGRFEIVDLHADQPLVLAGREGKAAYWQVIVGERSTTKGAISKSFGRIDAVLTGTEWSGKVDLDAFRAEMVATYGGTGVDIALCLTGTGKRGVEEAWAAFDVDDEAELWDIEIRVP